MARYSNKNEENEKEVKDSGRNESFAKDWISVEDDHLLILFEDVVKPTTTCLANNREGVESGRNERQSEGSSELKVEHQLDRLDGTGQHSIHLSAGSQTTKTKKNKPWNERSLLCYRKKKGQYNHTQDQCQYLHGEECDLCLKPVLHPFRKHQRDKHLLKCQARHTWEAERLEASRSVQCHVCLEIVLEKVAEADRRFALLEGCKHSCCWSCYESIKKFRNPNLTFDEWSRCSLCKQPYAFAVPSKFVVEDDQNRNRILSEFRKASRRKLCYQFRRTGTCDAGALCIFRHRGQATFQEDLLDIYYDESYHGLRREEDYILSGYSLDERTRRLYRSIRKLYRNISYSPDELRGMLSRTLSILQTREDF